MILFGGTYIITAIFFRGGGLSPPLCMYVCTYVRTYVCVCACMHASMYVLTYLCFFGFSCSEIIKPDGNNNILTTNLLCNAQSMEFVLPLPLHTLFLRLQQRRNQFYHFTLLKCLPWTRSTVASPTTTIIFRRRRSSFRSVTEILLLNWWILSLPLLQSTK